MMAPSLPLAGKVRAEARRMGMRRTRTVEASLRSRSPPDASLPSHPLPRCGRGGSARHRNAHDPRRALAPGSPPCVFVLFGANGDLTQRLVFPALYNLACRKSCCRSISPCSPSRAATTANRRCASICARASANIARRRCDRQIVDDLIARVSVAVADASDPASFDRLRETLADIDAKHETRGNRIFYLAIPPKGFAPTVRALGAAGLTQGESTAVSRA